MKKNLFYFLCLIILLSYNAYGQNRKFREARLIPLSETVIKKAVKVSPPLMGEEITPVKTSTSIVEKGGSSNSSLSVTTVIGNTTYDLQSNYSGLNTIYNSGSNIGASWTLSTDMSGAYPDRGTGINFSNNNGTSWQSIPIARIESDRRGWGNIDALGSGECVVSHKSGDSLGFYFRSTQGTGTWIHSGIPYDAANMNVVIWPRMKTGGANGQSVHIIGGIDPNTAIPYQGILGPMVYYRSQDAGATWDQQYVLLPGIDSMSYIDMGSDNYSVDVKGNTVAIVHGGFQNDFALWKSGDNGTTWFKKIIKPFPIPNYDPATMITDVDGDGIADTVETTDGSVEVLIDNNGMVHCWAGRMLVMNDGVGMAFFPATDGLYYWNENFSNYPPIILASSLDLDGDGQLTFMPSIPMYNNGITSMPSAGIDGASNIYLAYSSLVENTTNGLDQSYRNVYCMYSPNNGASWSVPVNISNSNFDEAVFPNVARDADSDIHLRWMQDGEPGLAVSGDQDPIGNNDIIYDVEDTTGLFTGIEPIDYIQNYITGTVYYDANQNGIKDVGENGMWQQLLLLLPDSIYTFTDMNGDYSFLVNTGIYNVSYVPGVNFQLASDSASFTVVSDTVMILSGYDFGAYALTQIYDLNSTLTASIPRCNNNVYYWIDYMNTGTMVIDTGTVTFVKEPLMTFIQSIPAYSTASGDTFVWNFYNLYPFEQRQIDITLNIAPPLNQGDTITNCETVYYDDGTNTRTSQDCLTQVIVCSLDPNDKAVRPEGVGIPHYALLSDTLEYTIRFQNTGTDTAFTVRITDTLDAILDINTFRFIASSHPVQIALQPNGELEFLFNNILLPDSNVNEPASNGFVKYEINAKQGTPDFSVVTNTAHIFFDWNPPVTTNTTMNTLVDALSVNEAPEKTSLLKIYPNPFHETALIAFDNPSKEDFTCTISDITGRTLKQINNITSEKVLINKEALSPGIYLLTLRNETGSRYYKAKFVIDEK